MKKHLLWWRRLVSRFSRKRRLVVVAGDSLPDILPRRDLVSSGNVSQHEQLWEN
jgi:hypothetical protein